MALEPAAVGGEPGGPPIQVAVRGRLTAPDPDQWLELDLEFRSVQSCVRCAREVETGIRATNRLLVVRGESEPAGGEVELSADDLGLVEAHGEELDTAPLVAEMVQLEQPMRPLCREDCRGICPICGSDRNEADCECEDRAIDPRWSALAEWKGRDRAPE